MGLWHPHSTGVPFAWNAECVRFSHRKCLTLHFHGSFSLRAIDQNILLGPFFPLPVMITGLRKEADVRRIDRPHQRVLRIVRK